MIESDCKINWIPNKVPGQEGTIHISVANESYVDKVDISKADARDLIIRSVIYRWPVLEDLNNEIRTKLDEIASIEINRLLTNKNKSNPNNNNNNLSRQVSYITLSDVEPKAVEWLWPGRFALGKVSIIAGDPGLGKSFLTLDIAARVTNGHLWPFDEGQAPQGRVILLSAEDDPADTIRPRLDAAGADSSLIHVIQSVQSVNHETGEEFEDCFSLATDIDTLDSVVTKLDNVRLVVVDPLTAYLGSTDSHKDSEVRHVLRPLAEFAARHHIAVICVMHLNKSQNHSQYRISGSVAFGAAARAAWVISKDPDDMDYRRRVMVQIKNNLAADPGSVSFEMATQNLLNQQSSHISWLQQIDMNADYALGNEVIDQDSKNTIDEAKDWILGALEDGSVLSGDLKKQASKDGLCWRTINTAKKQLGIKSKKTANGWEWISDQSAIPV